MGLIISGTIISVSLVLIAKHREGQGFPISPLFYQFNYACLATYVLLGVASMWGS